VTSVVVLPRPASGQSIFLWKIPLVLWFLISSFLPATQTPQFTFWDIPVPGHNVWLLAAAVVCFGGFLFAQSQESRPSTWHRNLPWWLLALLAYAALSLQWSGMDTSNNKAMLFTLGMAGAAFLMPYSVIASLTQEQIRSILRTTAFGLAAAGAVYSLESFFSLGLRSELGRSYSVGFGIDRVKGPLFESSVGHIVLLPAAAFLLQDLMATREGRVYKSLAAILISVSIVGLGSRAALLVVALFVATVIFVLHGVRYRLMIAALMAVGLAMAAGVVFSTASFDRLYSLADPRRLSTHITSMSAISNRDTSVNVLGSGYGSFWPWYLPDVEQGDLIARGGDMRKSEFGETLYQPHSVLLVLGVELGIVGLLFLIKLWSVLAGLIAGAWNGGRDAIFSVSVAVTSVAMFGDLIIFKNPKVSAIWWFYVLAAVALQSCSKKRSTAA
jgi:hypothetical protein